MLKFQWFARIADKQKASALTRRLFMSKARNFVLLGLGFHDAFPTRQMQREGLLPLLQMMKSKGRCPGLKLVWANNQAFGMLRRPYAPGKNYDDVLRHKAEMKQFLQEWDVPVFDPYSMTTGLVSPDGVHYGLGANRMKARVVMNFLQELYLSRQW
nr:hypothetical protein BaRGS_019559 [Batillaria attramentaria]